jgi:hypothetical protein
MSGGTITGNISTIASGGGGGVYLHTGGAIFTMNSGTIYGSDGGTDANIVTAGDTNGHAVYSAGGPKYRDNTVDDNDNIDVTAGNVYTGTWSP